MELMPIYHSVVADLEIDPAHPEAVASAGSGVAAPERPSSKSPKPGKSSTAKPA